MLSYGYQEQTCSAFGLDGKSSGPRKCNKYPVLLLLLPILRFWVPSAFHHLKIFSMLLLFSSLQATRATFPPRPSSQPVNIVHPLRPAPHSIPPRPRDPKPARPPPPVCRSPMVPTKAALSQAKLPPPKRPLPCSPVRTPLVSFGCAFLLDS